MWSLEVTGASPLSWSKFSRRGVASSIASRPGNKRELRYVSPRASQGIGSLPIHCLCSLPGKTRAFINRVASSNKSRASPVCRMEGLYAIGGVPGYRVRNEVEHEDAPNISCHQVSCAQRCVEHIEAVALPPFLVPGVGCVLRGRAHLGLEVSIPWCGSTTKRLTPHDGMLEDSDC